MYRFFETIKCIDGEIQLIDFHNERLNKTQQHFFGIQSFVKLQDIISLPCEYKSGLIKIRVEYSKYIENINFDNYEIKNHSSLKIIFDDNISYPFKNTDRSELNHFLIENSEYDDVIFVKNGLISDTSYANIILFKNGKWYTPDSPLFSGVKRRLFIENQVIETKSIKIEELASYEKIGFINAMRDFEKIYTFVIDQENNMNLCQIKQN